MSAGRIMLTLIALWIPAGAPRADVHLTADVPADLGGTRFLPWDIVRGVRTSYSLVLSLPPGTPVDALHRLSTGEWLLSVEAPTILGGMTYDPRDVVLFDGAASFALFLGGAAAGIPLGSNVDAVFLHGGDAGDLVVSFDVPTTIAGATYEPADLVRHSGGAFSLFFDASAATPPVPPSINVTGADAIGTRTLLTFDVPATLGAATYLPGEIVAWDGTAFSSAFLDPGWPPGKVMNALALGACPDADFDGHSTDPSCPTNTTLDCDDGDPGVFTSPAGVTGLDVAEIAGGFRFTWDSQAATAGPATVYDAHSGRVSTLRPGGDFSAGSCAADGLATPSLDYTGPPPPRGDALYFMFRAQNGCGTGTYGTPGRDAGAAASATPCL